MDNPRCYCPDCGADLGHFYNNRIHMVPEPRERGMPRGTMPRGVLVFVIGSLLGFMAVADTAETRANIRAQEQVVRLEAQLAKEHRSCVCTIHLVSNGGGQVMAVCE